MAKRIRVPITPKVLAWAIASSGVAPGVLADRVRVERTRVSQWLDGSDTPTLTEFKKIAKVLRRPTATFLLADPPSLKTPRVELRAVPGESPRDSLPQERERIREVIRLQRAVAWLLDELGEEGAELPTVRSSSSAATTAAHVRGLLGVSVTDQLTWRSEHEALHAWRGALESAGILVFLLPMGADASRGFSVWHHLAPVIASNTHWRASARIFTLHHELGHLVTRTSSICAEPTSRPIAAEGDGGIERWCERFAASLLMPEDALREQLGQLGGTGKNQVMDLDVAAKVAKRFNVSLRASVIRLVGLGLASWDLYHGLPRSMDSKPTRGGGSGRSRSKIRIDEYGRRTAQLFLRGLKRDVMDASEVMRYLDVSHRNLGELEQMLP